MEFQLPDDITSLPRQLRAAEPQAPKQLKHLLIAAAEQIEIFNHIADDAVRALDEAALLRVGLMDSDSRAQDVQRQMHAAMNSTADRLRHVMLPPPADDSAVI